jgi:hypothetical protein
METNMRKTFLGGMIGATLMIAFSFGASLLLANAFSISLIFSTENNFLKVVVYILIPIAGGFMAGLVAQNNPRQAGLLAGWLASMFLFLFWLASAGLTWPAIGSGLVLIFIWIFFGRLGGGFATSRKPSA